MEEEGVRRAYAQHAAADVRLCVFDGSAPIGEADADALSLVSSDSLVLLNKADLPVVKDLTASLSHLSPQPAVLRLSLHNGQGTDELLRALEGKLASMFASPEEAVPTRARHRELLQKVPASLHLLLLFLLLLLLTYLPGLTVTSA